MIAAHSRAVSVRIAATGHEDCALREYVADRKMLWEMIHRSYGKAGIAAARTTIAGADHRLVVARLVERLRDPRFTSATSPVEVAEMRVLVTQPNDFVSCVARGSPHL